MSRAFAGIASSLLLALGCGTARAERFVRAGGVEIHFNAFHADAVAAEAAAAHGIARSGRRGLVNVSVVSTGTDGMPRAVAARGSGSVTNLAGQRQLLAFRAVEEGNARYYLADFPIAGEDVYRFALEVRPAGASAPESIRFEQPLVGH